MSDKGSNDALLTGLPSQLARCVLLRLLRQDLSSRITCIVQSKHEADIGTFLSRLPVEQKQRVSVLRGDPTAMDLGLSGEEYNQVTSSVRRIYSLASLQPCRPSKQRSRVIVRATIEAIELARASKHLQLLTIVSSISAAGISHGIAQESELVPRGTDQGGLQPAYARAERIARRAMSRVPVVVVRPGIIVGSSEDGEIESFDGPYPLFLLLLGDRPPRLSALSFQGRRPLNLVPIDYVADTTAYIGSRPEVASKTFHIVDPAALPARRVFELFRREAARHSAQGRVPTHVIKSLLKSPSFAHLLGGAGPFVDHLISADHYAATNTEKVLRGTNVVCPPLEAYMDKLVSFVYQQARHQADVAWERASTRDDPLAE